MFVNNSALNIMNHECLHDSVAKVACCKPNHSNPFDTVGIERTQIRNGSSMSTLFMICSMIVWCTLFAYCSLIINFCLKIGTWCVSIQLVDQWDNYSEEQLTSYLYNMQNKWVRQYTELRSFTKCDIIYGDNSTEASHRGILLGSSAFLILINCDMRCIIVCELTSLLSNSID